MVVVEVIGGVGSRGLDGNGYRASIQNLVKIE